MGLHLSSSWHTISLSQKHLLQEVDTGNHTWANYFMCAYKARTFLAFFQLFLLTIIVNPCNSRSLKALNLHDLQGVFEHLASKGEQQPQLTGLQILVEGRVPLGRLPHPPTKKDIHPWSPTYTACLDKLERLLAMDSSMPPNQTVGLVWSL